MVVTRRGLHFPKPAWAKWRNEWVEQAIPQKSGETIDYPVWARMDYWPKDKRRRDIPAIQDAIWHVLEKAEIVKDDALIKSLHFYHWEGKPENKDGACHISLHRLTLR